jgi:hypothetical protein
MKKIAILCFAITLFGAVSVNAQGILDKIDRSLDKADKASRQADRAGKTGNKIGSLLGKKKGATDASAEMKTVVMINDIDFTTLKAITEKVENTKGVASAKMKFSKSGSTIILQHSGTTDDLLKALQKTNPTVFAERNIEGMEDGQISVTVKK